MHEWMLITSWLVYPWSLLGSYYRSRSTDNVYLLYLFCGFHSFMFILACFLRLLEGELKWGHRRARLLVSVMFLPRVSGHDPWKKCFITLIQSERENQQFLGQGSACLSDSLGDLLWIWRTVWAIPHTGLLTDALIPPKANWWSGAPPHTCELGTQTNWILCPHEQKCCWLKLRSMAKQSWEKLPFIKQRVLH